MKKPFPDFKTDEEAEAFVESAISPITIFPIWF